MAEEMHAFNAALRSPEARGVPGVPVRAAEIAWRRAINPESTRSGSSRLAKGLGASCGNGLSGGFRRARVCRDMGRRFQRRLLQRERPAQARRPILLQTRRSIRFPPRGHAGPEAFRMNQLALFASPDLPALLTNAEGRRRKPALGNAAPDLPCQKWSEIADGVEHRTA
jgi:hypothetical protein